VNARLAVVLLQAIFILSWEPPPVSPDAGAAEWFTIYRGQGGGCLDLLTPLPQAITTGAELPWTTLRFTDLTAAPIAGPVCYELTASNAAGESGRSARATVIIDEAPPAAPSVVTIQRKP